MCFAFSLNRKTEYSRVTALKYYDSRGNIEMFLGVKTPQSVSKSPALLTSSIVSISDSVSVKPTV